MRLPTAVGLLQEIHCFMPLRSATLIALRALLLAAGVLSLAHSPTRAESSPVASKKPVEVRDMESEQAASLRQIKKQLANFPEEPSPRPDESPAVRERRERRAQLQELVREIERRIAEEKSRKPLPKETFSVFGAYFKRVTSRIEQESTKAPPNQRDMKLPGSVILKLTIGSDGEIKELSTEEASSPEFAAYVQELVRSLAPFEPLSPTIRKRADHIAIVTKVSYAVR
jgi:protein TonB